MSTHNPFGGEDPPPLTGVLGDAHFATPQEVEAAGLLDDKGIRLGYYRSPEDKGEGWGKVIRYSGDAHLITVAPTGSGKGRDVLVGALLEYEGSCIVIDPKGQLAAITKARREQMGQKIIILSPLPKELPMDLGPSAKYNPMACLDPDSDAFGPNCEAIADSIVKQEEGPNSHFFDSARQLIAGVIMHLAVHGRDDEKNLVMVQQLVSGPPRALEAFIAEALSLDKEGFVTGKLARFASVSDGDRELRSIISTAITQCGFINNRAIGGSLRSSDFSFRDLKREPTTVYLVLPAKFIEPCGKWFRLILASAIAELWTDEKGKYSVLAMIDEFAQLGRLSVIADAMGMARGFGLQLWPILQDLTQLKEHYGDRWETFLGGAAVRQFFGPREHFTADYVSKLCGVKTVVAQGQSVQHAPELLQEDQTGASWGQQAQPLLHPHNVSGLGPNESLILGPQNVVIDAFRKPFFATEELAVLASPDPYHKHDAATPAGTPATLKAPADNFAEREWIAGRATRKQLTRKRSLFLRLLTPGRSDRPVWNVLRKLEYLLTLPLRLLAATLAAPFALHNRPLGAIIGFVALFGFWEVWNGFAQEPFLSVYNIEQEYCRANRWANDDKSHGHVMACKVEGLKATFGFFWEHLAVASWKHGFRKAISDFDSAFDQERNRSWAAAGIIADHIVYGHDPEEDRPKPLVSTARLSTIVVVAPAEGLRISPITDESAIEDLQKRGPIPTFMGYKLDDINLKQGSELQVVLKDDGTPARCELDDGQQAVDRAYCVFIARTGLYAVVLWTDFESGARDKSPAGHGGLTVRHRSLWTEIPKDEKVGEIYIVKDDHELPFYELRNPEDQKVIMRGNARASDDILSSAEAEVRLNRHTYLKEPDELRCILGDDGQPLKATYVYQPLILANEPRKPLAAVSSPYYLVRVYDGRLGLVDSLHYNNYAATPKTVKPE